MEKPQTRQNPNTLYGGFVRLKTALKSSPKTDKAVYKKMDDTIRVTHTGIEHTQEFLLMSKKIWFEDGKFHFNVDFVIQQDGKIWYVLSSDHNCIHAATELGEDEVFFKSDNIKIIKRSKVEV